MRIDNCNEWIPLGEVVARLGEVPRERVDELVEAIREFRRIAESESAAELYVFATEAMRAAKNHREVVKRIADETGVLVELITPRREAELGYRGVRLDTRDLTPNLMLEVGGGSAQVARVANDVVEEDVSLPIGTGKLIAESGLTNPCPPAVIEKADRLIQKALDECTVRVANPAAVVSGGVVRGLWRALHPDGEKRLSIEEMEYMVFAASRLSVTRLQTRFNVKAKRAGTLLPGALVYRALMRKFGLTQVAVSEFGVREGAILEMAAGRSRMQLK